MLGVGFRWLYPRESPYAAVTIDPEPVALSIAPTAICAHDTRASANNFHFAARDAIAPAKLNDIAALENRH